MPFAGFKDFADCVQSQTAKGKSKDSANKICGSLYQKFHELLDAKIEQKKFELFMLEEGKRIIDEAFDKKVMAAVEAIVDHLLSRWGKGNIKENDVEILDSSMRVYRDAKWNIEREMDKKNGAKPQLFEEWEEMSYKARKNLPDSAFVYPEERRYPIHDLAHARNALARVAANGTPAEKAKVKAAVCKKYPQIESCKGDK